MKKMLLLASLLISVNAFAAAIQETVVCDYMATLVKQTETGKLKVAWVNTLLVSNKDINTGFAEGKDLEFVKNNNLYVYSYPTATGSVKIQLGTNFYIITENYYGHELAEVRECKINPLRY